ncbi:hypothetical protein L7F22_044503 [Adiantum nelumboides]|nr:hypothetical protein [Adiantum nelumboides]
MNHAPAPHRLGIEADANGGMGVTGPIFHADANGGAAGDKDLLEALYASGIDASANSRNSPVTNDASVSAIFKTLKLTGLQVNEDMEYAYDSLRAEEVLNCPGVMQGLNSMMGADLTSVIGGSTWGTMPAARHIGDPAYQCKALSLS